jgi:hypothetical protein
LQKKKFLLSLSARRGPIFGYRRKNKPWQFSEILFIFFSKNNFLAGSFKNSNNENEDSKCLLSKWFFFSLAVYFST